MSIDSKRNFCHVEQTDFDDTQKILSVISQYKNEIHQLHNENTYEA